MQVRLHLVGWVLLTCTLVAVVAIRAEEDECPPEVDDCIKVVAPRVEPMDCPSDRVCLTDVLPHKLSCWDDLVGQPGSVLTSPYGEERGSSTHGGIDIAAATGEPVHAAKDGVVVELEGSLPENDHSTPNGNFIRIDHDDGTQGVLLHLLRVHVKVGERVLAGQHVGDSNNTGSSSGPHLHYSNHTPPERFDMADPTLEHGNC